MVSSSNPSLSQSRRGLAPAFSKGKTRKIPWPLKGCAGFEACPRRTLGDKTASRTSAVAGSFRRMFTKKLYQTARTCRGVLVALFYGKWREVTRRNLHRELGGHRAHGEGPRASWGVSRAGLQRESGV